MTARRSIVGLDGADLGVVNALGAARLPALHALMRRGAFAALESVEPPATLPNWTTFLTGVDPGAHGVFDFTTAPRVPRAVHRGHRARGADRRAHARSRSGSRAHASAFPATCPPERLAHGVFISGWDSPVAFEADRSFVWPRSSLRRDRRALRRRCDSTTSTSSAAEPARSWHAALRDGARRGASSERQSSREWLLARREWDRSSRCTSARATRPLTTCGACTTELAAAARRRERGGGGRARAGLRGARPRARPPRRRGGRATARGHGRQRSRLGRELRPRALPEPSARRGRAPRVSRGAPARSRIAGGLKEARAHAHPAAPTRPALPSRAERCFRACSSRAPGTAAIDFARTSAFSDELNYFPSVSLNVRGREPRGIGRAARRAGDATRVEKALLAVRDPWSGEAVVDAVIPREELYRGPHVERAPDLVVRCALTESGHSVNVQPSGGPGPTFRSARAGRAPRQEGTNATG